MKEAKLTVGYEQATYEANGIQKPYNKYYVILNGYKYYFKLTDTTAKEIYKDVVDSQNK